MRRLHPLCILILVAGCAPALNVPALTPSHPASPEAKEAPLAKTSTTLSLPRPGAGSGSESPLPREHATPRHAIEPHGAHAGHDMGIGSHAHHGADDAQ